MKYQFLITYYGGRTPVHQLRLAPFVQRVDNAIQWVNVNGVAEWFRALVFKSGGPWFKSSTSWICSRLVPSSTPRPRFVNSQLLG